MRWPQLVLLVERLKAGDTAGAAATLPTRLPTDGVHRFVGPLALAWTRMAAGDLAGADAALQAARQIQRLRAAQDFQLGLLYDFAGHADKAAGQLTSKPLAASEPAQLAADRRDRAISTSATARPTRRKALYQRFVEQNAGSELAAVGAGGAGPPGVPQPLIGSAERRAGRGAVRPRQRAQPDRDDRSRADLRPVRARRCARISRSRSCCSPTC